ncbi:hypothetical protein Hamer_G000458, partial [Homarus americanus]
MSEEKCELDQVLITWFKPNKPKCFMKSWDCKTSVTIKKVGIAFRNDTQFKLQYVVKNVQQTRMQLVPMWMNLQNPSGFKESEECIVMCCSNAVSTHRCKLLVIGKSPERNACTGSDEDESSEENEEDVETESLLTGRSNSGVHLDNPLPSTSRQVEAFPVLGCHSSDKDDNPDSPSAV